MQNDEPVGTADEQCNEAKPSLTQKAARGTAWTAGATLAAKLIAFAGQIFLARLLTPDDWGTVGLAMTVAAFTGLVVKGGIREGLISRQAHFREWRNTGFLLSALFGAGGAVLTALAGPVAASIYQLPALVPMMFVLSVGNVFDGLSTVPEAELTSNLRFRVLALSAVVTYALQVTLSVMLANCGFGAMSMIIPLPLVSLTRCAIYVATTLPVPALKVDQRQSRTLLKDCAVITGTRFFDTVQGYTDYTVLGLFHPKTLVGAYFFAYNLSVQLIVLFAANLSAVLFPVWSQLRGQPERQLASFVRAMQVLAAVSVPLCIIQAAVARPMLHFFFTSRWDAAIVPLQILSIGTALRIAGGPAINLLQSQGRFRTVLSLSIGTSAVLVLSLLIAGYLGGGPAVACTESACFFVSHLWQLSLIFGARRSLTTAAGIYGMPIVLSGIATGLAWLAFLPLSSMVHSDLLELVFIGAVSSLAYGTLLRIVRPSLWRELVATLNHLLGGRRGWTSRSAVPERIPVAPAHSS